MLMMTSSQLTATMISPTVSIQSPHGIPTTSTEIAYTHNNTYNNNFQQQPGEVHQQQQQQQILMIPTSPDLNAQTPLAAAAFVLPANETYPTSATSTTSSMMTPFAMNTPTPSSRGNTNVLAASSTAATVNIIENSVSSNNNENQRGSHHHRLQVRTQNLQSVVRLPAGTDINHWLSIHTIDFYGITHLLYGSVTQYCTEQSCPIMGCGSKYEYHWKDVSSADPLYHKSTRVSAPCYVKLMMRWVERQITNDTIFPSDAMAHPIYPEDFIKQVKTIFKRLFRVYAHLYASHYTDIVALGEEHHLQTSFKHFLLFSAEFKLVPQSELRPLRELIVNMMGRGFYDEQQQQQRSSTTTITNTNTHTNTVSSGVQSVPPDIVSIGGAPSLLVSVSSTTGSESS